MDKLDELQEAFRRLAGSCDKCSNDPWKVFQNGYLKYINLCETCLDKELGFKLSQNDKRGLERLKFYLETDRSPEVILAEQEAYDKLGIPEKPRPSFKIKVKNY